MNQFVNNQTQASADSQTMTYLFQFVAGIHGLGHGRAQHHELQRRKHGGPTQCKDDIHVFAPLLDAGHKVHPLQMCPGTQRQRGKDEGHAKEVGENLALHFAKEVPGQVLIEQNTRDKRDPEGDPKPGPHTGQMDEAGVRVRGAGRLGRGAQEDEEAGCRQDDETMVSCHCLGLGWGWRVCSWGVCACSGADGGNSFS